MGNKDKNKMYISLTNACKLKEDNQYINHLTAFTFSSQGKAGRKGKREGYIYVSNEDKLSINAKKRGESVPYRLYL